MAKIKIWIHAARLRTLPLSLSGIIVGSAIAFHDGIFNWSTCLLALLTTLFFQVLSNFANDLGDTLKGADNEHRVGPTRAVQSGGISVREMKIGVTIMSVVSLISSLLLIAVSAHGKDWDFWLFYSVLAFLCIIAAILYTVGKKAYGYHGMGDIFVFLFFGFVSVIGVYHLYPDSISFSTFNWSLIFPAITIGGFSTAVLNLNNMRDRINDEKVGKRTLVVKLGLPTAKMYHATLVILSMMSFTFYVAITQADNAFQLTLLLPFVLFFFELRKIISVQVEKDFDPFLKTTALTTFMLSILFTVNTYIYHVTL